MDKELLAILVGVVGILLTVIFQALYLANKMGKFEEKLDNVEKKQDKYNNVITRTFNLEKGQGIQEEQIRVVNHRISDLEQGINK